MARHELIRETDATVRDTARSVIWEATESKHQLLIISESSKHAKGPRYLSISMANAARRP